MTSTTAQTQLELYRQQFPALANKAYFNFGGQGPMSQAAIEAIFQSYEFVQRVGPFSAAMGDWVEQESQLTRQAIASELGVSAATITLTENVTVGCNIPLWGIDWKAGDHLLISDCEHPGIILAVQEIARQFNLQVSEFPLMDTLNQGDPVAVIAQHLQPNTRLVVLSHILWNTGQVLPLAEIAQVCHQNGDTKVLVDAAQSVGVLPLNLSELGVDFYAFTGHKWWCGPEGVGGLYVRPEVLESLNPTFVGWRSLTYGKNGMTWQPDGRRFEVATSAYPLYAGLRTAIALHHQWGSTQERYQQIQQLSQDLWQKLANLPQVTCLKTSPPKAGLVSWQIASKSHQKLVLFLEKQGFLIRTIRHPDCVRACVHYFTSSDEIDRLVEAIHQFC